MPSGNTHDDPDTPESDTAVGQKRGCPSALQLGPRKKPFIYHSTFIFNIADHYFSVLLKTLSSTIGVTLEGLCMRSAMYRPSSLMA